MTTRTARAGRRVLVIDDASAPSLVACLLQRDAASLRTWYTAPAHAPTRCRTASQRRFAALALDARAEAPSPGKPGEPGSVEEGLRASTMLLAAAREAVRAGCDTLVWPIHCGWSVDLMAAAADRAQGVERLVALDIPADAPLLRIDLPLLDLDDDQVAELMLDLDAPRECVWWCLHEGEAPCSLCEGCMRWEGALSRARFAARA